MIGQEFVKYEEELEKKFHIVPQTKIAFIGYILLIVAQLIFVYKQPNSGMYIPNVVAFIIIAALGLYVINCAVVGSCHMYAYIVGYIVACIGIIAVSSLVYMSFKS